MPIKKWHALKIVGPSMWRVVIRNTQMFFSKHMDIEVQMINRWQTILV